MTKRSYDIILFGATSSSGIPAFEYLLELHREDPSFKWAVAGRNVKQLTKLCEQLGCSNEVDIIVADSMDKASLLDMCVQTRVVASTVGPYALYGEQLITACIETETDYCDITGEAAWVKDMIDRYGEQAQKAKVRLVSFCGNDSLPSDLGVYHLQTQAKALLGEPARDIKMRIKENGGTPPPGGKGTIASIINIVREVQKDKTFLETVLNPYLLAVDGAKTTDKQGDKANKTFDEEFDAWSGPFLMGVINTRVVMRSNSILNYHEAMTYEEGILTGKGLKGSLLGSLLTLTAPLRLLSILSFPGVISILEKFVIPRLAGKYDDSSKKEAYYDFRFYGKTDSGKFIETSVNAKGKGGYAATSKMLVQCAMCLAFDLKEKDKTGFFTTAELFGDAMIDRLGETDVMHYDVIEHS